MNLTGYCSPALNISTTQGFIAHVSKPTWGRTRYRNDLIGYRKSRSVRFREFVCVRGFVKYHKRGMVGPDLFGARCNSLD